MNLFTGFVIDAWRDDEFYESLPEEKRSLVPVSPAGGLRSGILAAGTQAEKSTLITQTCSTLISDCCSTLISQTCSTLISDCCGLG